MEIGEKKIKDDERDKLWGIMKKKEEKVGCR